MDEIWQKRWLALNAAMGRLMSLLQNDYRGKPRQATLETTLRDLQRTSEALFNVMYSTPANELEQNTGFTSEFLMRSLLDQVAFDLDVLSTAAAQRFYASDDIKIRFAVADNLAYTALKPAIEAQLVHSTTTVLTYMAESARVRVIPYAPVALIAIPFTAANVPADLLATAHEIGHYVFWHGQFDDVGIWPQLRGPLPPSPANWYYQWREEMFADIYGAIVAGVPIALSGQDLLLDNNPDEYWDNDKEHPVIDLRPHIYSKVLHEVGGDQRAWEPFVRQRWQEKKQIYAAQLGGRFFLESKRTDLSKSTSSQVFRLDVAGMVCDDTALAVDKAVCQIFNLLKSAPKSVAPGNWLAPLPNEGSVAPSQANIDKVYAQFEAFLVKLNSSAQELKANNVVRSVEELSSDNIVNLVAELVLDNVISKERWENLENRIAASDKDTDEWKRLVKLHGWVTRGPEEPPDPPKP